MSTEKNQENSNNPLNIINAVNEAKNEAKKKKKRKALKRKLILAIILLVFLAAAIFFLMNSTSVGRAFKSCQSDMTGGLYREVNVYTPTGELIAHYEGKIDIEENETGGKVLFDMDGKRYIYYNCLVEVIEIDEPKD